MKHTHHWFFTIVIIFSMSMTSIAQDGTEELIEPAIIDDVSIDDSDGITLTISGSFPDTCTQLGDIEQSVSDETIEVMVMTTRPADAMCGAAITPFETELVLETRDLDTGDYTLLVNTVELSITIGEATAEVTEEPSLELTCPEPEDDTLIFDDNGLCFAYPVDFDILAGGDFIFISQPMTSNAVLLIEISEATEDMSLEDLQDEFEEDEVLITNVVIGGADTLIIEDETMREAYSIADEMLYHLILQPLEEDDETGELLWSTVIDSLVFEEIDH